MPSHAYRGFRADAHRPGGRHHRHLAAVSVSRRRGDAQRGDQPARARHGQATYRTASSSCGPSTRRARSAPGTGPSSTAPASCRCWRCRAPLPPRARQLTTRAESPAGAGIAGSSALTIALCGALARSTGASMNPDDLLQVAMNIECQTIQRADRRAGLPARAVRRHRRDRAQRGRRQACRARRRPARARTANRPGLHGRAAAFGHEQLGDHQAAHRRRSRHLRLLRAHSRHGGRDARGVDARATGTRSAGRSPSSGTTASGWRPA